MKYKCWESSEVAGNESMWYVRIVYLWAKTIEEYSPARQPCQTPSICKTQMNRQVPFSSWYLYFDTFFHGSRRETLPYRLRCWDPTCVKYQPYQLVKQIQMISISIVNSIQIASKFLGRMTARSAAIPYF